MALQPHPRLLTAAALLVLAAAIWLVSWLTPGHGGASVILRVDGQSQVQVAASAEDLDRLARGLPAQSFPLANGSSVRIVHLGIARAEIETPDGRHGWVPFEWLK